MPDWPHAPVHRLREAGAYMVTASTYQHQPLFTGPERLTLVRDKLFALAKELGWELQAWAIMPNHYHFIALSPERGETLTLLIRRLHGSTGKKINIADGALRRRVWFQYWDSLITFEKSYFARLNYVNQNPVKHGMTREAEAYPWCSAACFARAASPAFYRTVKSFPIDRVNVVDIDCEG